MDLWTLGHTEVTGPWSASELPNLVQWVYGDVPATVDTRGWGLRQTYIWVNYNISLT